jgi:hypothetical protein
MEGSSPSFGFHLKALQSVSWTIALPGDGALTIADYNIVRRKANTKLPPLS